MPELRTNGVDKLREILWWNGQHDRIAMPEIESCARGKLEARIELATALWVDFDDRELAPSGSR